jgi:hypothetical protein
MSDPFLQKTGTVFLVKSTRVGQIPESAGLARYDKYSTSRMRGNLGKNMRIKIAAVLVLMLGVATQAQARGPYGTIKVAGWQGGAYTNDQTGEFSNCIASANYKSGINFGVLVTKNITWALAFSHPNWSLSTNQKFPIVLSFNGRNTFNVTGIAMSGSGVIVPMPDTSDLIKSFRAAKTMSAFAQGNLFQFDLAGTSVVIVGNSIRLASEVESGDALG